MYTYIPMYGGIVIVREICERLAYILNISRMSIDIN